jgi:hypothetical protein
MTESSLNDILVPCFLSLSFISDSVPTLTAYYLHLLLAAIFLFRFQACFSQIKYYAHFHVLFLAIFNLFEFAFRELKAFFSIKGQFFEYFHHIYVLRPYYYCLHIILLGSLDPLFFFLR